MTNKTILNLISQHLAKRGYQISKHLRLSQHSADNHNNQKDGMPIDVFYQGLTLVTQSTSAVLSTASEGSPAYVYKWQLSPCHSQAQLQSQNKYEQQQQSPHLTFGLYQEIECLQSIHHQSRSAHHLTSSIDSGSPVVPILVYDNNFILSDTEQAHRWQGVGFMMPYFAQGSVKHYLASHNNLHQNSLDIHHKIKLAQAMVSNLRQLHQLGWVHGDIKPSNFLISSTNTDFSTYLSDLSCAFQVNDNTNATSTALATLSGTAAYMPPECWQGQPKSEQSDIYALGITLYEVFMGEKPFVANKLSGWAQSHCQQPLPLLSEPLSKQVPALQVIMDKLLAKQVDNRYQCMDEVCSDVSQLQRQ
ncbi:protein kinase domain-containing protein [Psychrobacter sp. FDAARGOS_221]|uniref:protein kinase domain-containing protein n=1 Tax=Psychrobacter sp. FDAARGOS_221 TaxID=1975705 RepID=UPI000BB544CE|nr:protein kinase [Psychrobacter sp. FDAARGOS_221]PNK61365.1 hypothetical protein A6J60_011175 [Psychrobacter sp. FDAARGOS_221]